MLAGLQVRNLGGEPGYLLFGALFGEYVKVFVVSLHPVFFPGVFLERSGIRLQLLEFLFGILYLSQVIIAAFFQLVKFAFVFEVRGDDILIIEEAKPYPEYQRGEQVFILYPGGYVLEKLHGS